MLKQTSRVAIAILLAATVIIGCKKTTTSTSTSTTSSSTTATTSGSGCEGSTLARPALPYSINKDTTFLPGIYPVKSSLTINKDAHVILQAGVTFVLDAGYDITVYGNLKTLGTATCPVIITGKVKTPGYWGQLNIRSINPDNLFNYTTFEYGGAGGFSDSYGNVVLTQDGTAGFKNCQFNNSLSNGLSQGDHQSIIYNLDNCSFLNNARYPLIIGIEMADKITSNTIFKDNGTGKIALNIFQEPVNKDITLSPLALPFTLFVWSPPGRLYNYNFKITINAGVTLIMDQDYAINIEDNAQIQMLGTATAPIIVKGAKSVPGYWRGLLFRNTLSDNIIQYVQFFHIS